MGYVCAHTRYLRDLPEVPSMCTGIPQSETAAQGGSCALLGTQCCIFVPDNLQNITTVSQGVYPEIKAVENLTDNPLQTWWASLGSGLCWTLIIIGSTVGILIVSCSSLYCCCGLWLQSSALWACLHTRRTPSV